MSKIRLDYVTNSSSSSYICDICGGDESGYDLGLSDCNMYQCTNGHTFHEHCTSKVDKRELLKMVAEERFEEHKDSENDWGKKHAKVFKDVLDLLNSDEQEGFNDKFEQITNCDDISDFLYNDAEVRYYYPAKACPICNMTHIKAEDLVKHLLKTYGLNEELTKEEMRIKYSNNLKNI